MFKVFLWVILIPLNIFAQERSTTFSKIEGLWHKSLQTLPQPDSKGRVAFQSSCIFYGTEATQKSPNLSDVTILVQSDPFSYFIFLRGKEIVDPMEFPDGEYFHVVIKCEPKKGWGCW